MTGAPSWRRALRSLALSIVTAILWVSPATANGGTIQVSMERAGPYEVTVLTDPSPIRVGVLDVSVMVERPGGSLVQDARVMVTATPAGSAESSGKYEATHDRATNKLFYAADVPISRAGPWQIEVAITSGLGEGAVSFAVEATEPSIPDRLPLVVLIVIFVGLIAASGVVRHRSARDRLPGGGRGRRLSDGPT